MEGLVYDFMINDKRVQEKVGSFCKPHNPNIFLFNLSKFKCIENGKHKQQNYQEGDNALYWLNCKNNKEQERSSCRKLADRKIFYF